MAHFGHFWGTPKMTGKSAFFDPLILADFGGSEIELTCGAKSGQICKIVKNGAKKGGQK